jgi:hypothetical protein
MAVLFGAVCIAIFFSFERLICTAISSLHSFAGVIRTAVMSAGEVLDAGADRGFRASRHVASCSLLARLISHQPAVLFSQNKSATSNQLVVLFFQNKPAPAISHLPTEQADDG